MLKSFIKYQSLGNDFIIFDWYKKSNKKILDKLTHKNWHNFVQKICNRHSGIGANGLLILKQNIKLKLPEVIIFNSDGSNGEICLNGVRCLSHYLHIKYNFPKQFRTVMRGKIINCTISSSMFIINKINDAKYLKDHQITTTSGKFNGSAISIGNPHFIIFEKRTIKWLNDNGNIIEQHSSFPQKTNVEFIWPKKSTNEYNVLIYERGCGITNACSSGAAAITWLLFSKNIITINEKIKLHMPGGLIICWIDKKTQITLKAKSTYVFSGKNKQFSLN